MARLTFEKEDGTWGIKGYDIKKVPGVLYGALCKLRMYERTNLTPEQIEEMDELYLEKCKEINRLNTELEELKQQYTQFPAAVLKGEKHV